MGCSNPISPTFPRTPDGAPSRRGTRTTPRYSPISTPNSRAWFEVRLTRCWRELDSNFQFRAGDGFGFSLPDAHRCALGLMPPPSGAVPGDYDQCRLALISG